MLRRHATALCALVLFALTASAQTTPLDALIGRDLWKDRLSNDAQERLNRTIGRVPKGFEEPGPWRVWRTNHNGVTRYIVLLGAPMLTIPGGSSACVLLLDNRMQRVNNWCFQTGWRINLDRATLTYAALIGSDMIALHMRPVINGRNIAREYFTIKDDQLRFVRLEDDKGDAVPNDCLLPNFEIGIVPTPSNDEAWITMLQSSDKAEVLSALVFLGGRHLKETQRSVVSNEPTGSKYAITFRSS